jgi:hypothetical protein
VSHARIESPELFQDSPGGALAEQEVLIARFSLPLERGVGDAHAQPGADERIQHLQLGLAERRHRMVASHHMRRGSQWIGLVHDGVRDADGQLTHARAVRHVAKVEQPGYPAISDEEVVIIRIVVEQARGQPLQAENDDRRVWREQALDQRAPLGAEQMQVGSDPSRSCQIPLLRALHATGWHVPQRGIHPRERLSQALQEAG